MSNLDRYKAALDDLSKRGGHLELALNVECSPKVRAKLTASEEGKELLKKLPNFDRGYQAWYTEALALVRQVIPDRLANFVSHYEAPKGRKELSVANYRLEDCLLGLQATWGGEVVVSRSAGMPHIQAQVEIVKAAATRFESVLFDIRKIEQADLFDSELDAARSLADHGYGRAAGAMAGVVLEHHLSEVCSEHAAKLTKKNLTIADYNEALKLAGVIEMAQWRFIQHLADIRNKCDHKKSVDPTSDEVTDLLDGVAKIIKTVH